MQERVGSRWGHTIQHASQGPSPELRKDVRERNRVVKCESAPLRSYRHPGDPYPALVLLLGGQIRLDQDPLIHKQFAAVERTVKHANRVGRESSTRAREGA